MTYMGDNLPASLKEEFLSNEHLGEEFFHFGGRIRHLNENQIIKIMNDIQDLYDEFKENYSGNDDEIEIKIKYAQGDINVAKKNMQSFDSACHSTSMSYFNKNSHLIQEYPDK